LLLRWRRRILGVRADGKRECQQRKRKTRMTRRWEWDRHFFVCSLLQVISSRGFVHRESDISGMDADTNPKLRRVGNVRHAQISSVAHLKRAGGRLRNSRSN
jgi:hypothetical protein